MKKIKKEIKVKKNKKVKSFNQFVFKIKNSKEQIKMLVSNKGLLNYAQNIYDDLDLDTTKKYKKFVNSNNEFDNVFYAVEFLNSGSFGISVTTFKTLENFLTDFVNKGKAIYFEDYNKETVVVNE